jgi:glutathione S-transferase
MSEIILHHYQLSPYSEKVRLAFGLKGLSRRSVEIPIWTPRPKLTPMTGGYRRTPILQIGAEFYCDTLLILRIIEKLRASNSLYPSGQEGLVKAFCWSIEKSSFMNAVCLTVSNMGGKLPAELIEERRPFFGINLEPSELLPKRGIYLQRVNAHFHWLGETLADGRRFIFGQGATAADLAAYHPIWFIRQNAGPEIEALLSIDAIGPWYDRAAAIGHGSVTDMAPEEAIEIAKSAQPNEAKNWSSEAQNVGLKLGGWVSVTPDDYGSPVFGRLLVWDAEEVVIGHEDPSVGRVSLHFPRAGFDVRPERKAA